VGPDPFQNVMDPQHFIVFFCEKDGKKYYFTPTKNRAGNGGDGGTLQEVHREGQVRDQDPGPEADARRRRSPGGEPPPQPARREGSGH
jgi:hypothetical protein